MFKFYKKYLVALSKIFFCFSMFFYTTYIFSAPPLPPPLPSFGKQNLVPEKTEVNQTVQKEEPPIVPVVNNKVTDIKLPKQTVEVPQATSDKEEPNPQDPEEVEEPFLDLGDSELPRATEFPSSTDNAINFPEKMAPIILNNSNNVSAGADTIKVPNLPNSTMEQAPSLSDTSSTSLISSKPSLSQTPLEMKPSAPDLSSPPSNDSTPKLESAVEPTALKQDTPSTTTTPSIAAPTPDLVTPKMVVEEPLTPVEVGVEDKNIPSTTAKTVKAEKQEIVVEAQKQPNNVDTKSQENPIVKEISPESKKFAKDEVQMLLLPDDEIVLGKLTLKAIFEQMDIYSYIKIAKDKEDKFLRKPRYKLTQSLVSYDENMSKNKLKCFSEFYSGAIPQAFRAVKRNDLLALRVLLDNYPILQKNNRAGDTLLSTAVKNNNYYLTKFLIMRGIKLSSLDSDCQTSLGLANDQGYSNIACLLMSAAGY